MLVAVLRAKCGGRAAGGVDSSLVSGMLAELRCWRTALWGKNPGLQ